MILSCPRPLAALAALLLVPVLLLLPTQEVGAVSQFDYVAYSYSYDALYDCYYAYDSYARSTSHHDEYDWPYLAFENAYYGYIWAEYAYETGDVDVWYGAAYYFYNAYVLAYYATQDSEYGLYYYGTLANNAVNGAYYAFYYCAYAWIYGY